MQKMWRGELFKLHNMINYNYHHNNNDMQEHFYFRQEARALILEKNPTAFKSSIGFEPGVGIIITLSD